MTYIMNKRLKKKKSAVSKRDNKNSSENHKDSFAMPVKCTEILKTPSNDDITKNIHSVPISKNCSTPVRPKDHVNNKRDSPEQELSPISIPLTQDGGNEVAWDWQSSLRKSIDIDNCQTNNSTTPKRRKLLQKKRNSNSPLLYKPLKRKSKEEQMESIGLWKAELMALSERVKTIQEKDQNIESNNELNENYSENQSIVKLSIGHETTEIESTTHKKCKKIDCTKKTNSEYEELLDDSIDEYMTICSQEIEKRFKICEVQENLLTMTDQNKISISESPEHLSESLKNSDVSNIKRKIHPNKCTYFNNNIINNNSNSVNKKTECDSKDLLKFPDDSFDDCLATCVEEEKLTNMPINESSLQNKKETFKSSNQFANSSKTNYPVSEISSCFTFDDISNLTNNTLVCENDKNKIKNNDTTSKEVENNSISELMQSRKFFKSRCLSDSNFEQQNKTQSKNLIRANSSSKISSVSINLDKIFQSSTVSNTQPLTANRFAKKGDGKYVSSCDSTNKMNTNNIKENSHISRCTPEEIERKRLEAKMKLEAKRKMQLNTIIKKSVKR